MIFLDWIVSRRQLQQELASARALLEEQGVALRLEQQMRESKDKTIEEHKKICDAQRRVIVQIAAHVERAQSETHGLSNSGAVRAIHKTILEYLK